METIEKKITKTVTEVVTTYVAVDGTEFKDKEECEKYEQSAKCVITSRYRDLITSDMCRESQDVGRGDKNFGLPTSDIPLDVTMSEDDSLYAIKLNLARDVDTANMYLKDRCGSSTGTVFNYNDIGKTFIVVDYYLGSYVFGTPDALREKFERSLDYIINGAPTCKDCKHWNGSSCSIAEENSYQATAKADRIWCGYYEAKEIK